jgi:hypothetical protein
VASVDGIEVGRPVTRRAVRWTGGQSEAPDGDEVVDDVVDELLDVPLDELSEPPPPEPDDDDESTDDELELVPLAERLSVL